MAKGMKQHLAHIALVVRDYDEAIEFYTKKTELQARRRHRTL